MKRQIDSAEKTYIKCLSCPFRGVRCKGISPSDMQLDLWCVYMKDLKAVKKLTNAEIYEQSGVSLKTIEKIMAINTDQDIMRDTARRIESVLIGTEGSYPCYLAFQEENMPEEKKHSDAMHELEHALSENREYRAVLENIHASYKAELETVRGESAAVKLEAQKKIDYLLDLVAKLRADNDNLWRLINHMTKDDKL